MQRVFQENKIYAFKIHLLRSFVKHNALQWTCYFFSSLVETFPEYFTDYLTANTIQLVIDKFSHLFICVSLK